MALLATPVARFLIGARTTSSERRKQNFLLLFSWYYFRWTELGAANRHGVIWRDCDILHKWPWGACWTLGTALNR